MPILAEGDTEGHVSVLRVKVQVCACPPWPMAQYLVRVDSTI